MQFGDFVHQLRRSLRSRQACRLASTADAHRWVCHVEEDIEPNFQQPRSESTSNGQRTFLGASLLAGSCGGLGLGLGVSPKPLPACKTARLRLLKVARVVVSGLLTRNAGIGRTSVLSMRAVADAARLIRAMAGALLLQRLLVCACAWLLARLLSAESAVCCCQRGGGSSTLHTKNVGGTVRGSPVHGCSVARCDHES